MTLEPGWLWRQLEHDRISIEFDKDLKTLSHEERQELLKMGGIKKLLAWAREASKYSVTEEP